MWYNGLQVNFNQRFSHGLVFTASYTRSRQIEQWGWMNQYLRIPQRSPYGFDHPNVFKVSGAYDLPFGKGRTFKMGGSRIADYALRRLADRPFDGDSEWRARGPSRRRGAPERTPTCRTSTGTSTRSGDGAIAS